MVKMVMLVMMMMMMMIGHDGDGTRERDQTRINKLSIKPFRCISPSLSV
jgi:hypothetical protein